MGAVAAAALAADRRLVQALSERSATSESTAVSIDTASRFERARLERLESRGIVHRVANDLYYLDELKWEERDVTLRRLRVALLLLALALAAALFVFARGAGRQ